MHDGIDSRKVARLGVGILATLAIVVAIIVWLTHRLDRGSPGGLMQSPQRWISGPLLESDPQADMAHFLESKQRVLKEYGWVDRPAGIARIPIEAAMRALAEPGRRGKADPR